MRRLSLQEFFEFPPLHYVVRFLSRELNYYERAPDKLDNAGALIEMVSASFNNFAEYRPSKQGVLLLTGQTFTSDSDDCMIGALVIMAMQQSRASNYGEFREKEEWECMELRCLERLIDHCDIVIRAIAAAGIKRAGWGTTSMVSRSDLDETCNWLARRK